jgi:hypothetical protein
MVMNSELRHKVVVDTDWPKAEEWCIEFVGEWDTDWYKLGIDPVAHLFEDNRTTWYFKDEHKMAMFLLRWA